MATRRKKKASKRAASKANGAKLKAYIPLTDIVQRLPVELRSLALLAFADVVLAVEAHDAETLAAIRRAARVERLATQSTYLAAQRLCEKYLADEGPSIAAGERPSLRELRAGDLARLLTELGLEWIEPHSIVGAAHDAKTGRALAERLLVIASGDGDELAAKRKLRDAQPAVRQRRHR